MPEFTSFSWIIIAAAGLAAGFVDSIAGGGGLLAVPALLAVGLPPHLALGTNKLQSVFGSGTAAWRYGSKGLIPWRRVFPGIVTSLFAAALGAWTVGRLDIPILSKALPFFLTAVWLYVALKRDLGDRRSASRIRPELFYPAGGTLIGFYDGFLGPGTGSYWTVSQVSLTGMDLKEATAATKPMNFASNLGALVVFFFTGHTVLTVGLLMAAGQVAGAWLGSRLVIRHRPRFIRPFFLVVVAATIIKLFIDQFVAA